MADCVPLDEKPIVLELGIYKPVVKFPVKFNDGFEAEPTGKVIVLLLLDSVVMAVTLDPSQTIPKVDPWGMVIVEAPEAVVLNVSVNAPEVPLVIM